MDVTTSRAMIVALSRRSMRVGLCFDGSPPIRSFHSQDTPSVCGCYRSEMPRFAKVGTGKRPIKTVILPGNRGITFPI
jgi:hypothetical protein